MTGSGNPLTPCSRMHFEIANSSCSCCWDACAGGPPPGNRFLHEFRACWTAGDDGLMPLPWVIWPLSGMFGTPFPRMHLAN